jgi:polyisoprenoid-binding protein YceI
MTPGAHRIATGALGLILAAAPASAEEWQIEMDPQLTSVSFKLKATMHSVHGTAATTSGGFRFDPDTGAVTGEIVIDATSAETGNGSRDKKMHRKVLVTADNPRIVLRIRRLEGSLALEGASEVTLRGEIEILGSSHEVAIPLHIEIGDGRFTAEGGFEIPYVEWGLDDPSTFILKVAKEVRVTIETAGTIIVVD